MALPPAGYEAKALDGTLAKYLSVAEKSIRHAEQLSTRVESVLAALEGKAVEADEANEVTILFDRVTKANLNLVKAIDELSRLRSFLAGGPDSRPDLTISGELELRAIVLHAVKSLGLKVVSE